MKTLKSKERLADIAQDIDNYINTTYPGLKIVEFMGVMAAILSDGIYITSKNAGLSRGEAITAWRNLVISMDSIFLDQMKDFEKKEPL